LPALELETPATFTAPRRSFVPALKWATMLGGLIVVAVVALLVLPGRHHSSAVYLAKSANVTSAPARTVGGAVAGAVTEYDQVTVSAANRNEAAAKSKKADRATADSAFTSSGAMARLNLPAQELKERQNGVAASAQAAPAKPAAPPTPAAAPALTDARHSSAPSTRTMADAERAKDEAANVTAVPAFRWKLSDAGAVLRSTDDGANWQPARLDASTRFRALSVFAPHVWAGGADGNVYHSPDSGAHWEVLRPATTEGVPLSGEIVGMEFSDALHGRVTSSATEIWTTVDGGHTWSKQ
jgi:hypothetical protein